MGKTKETGTEIAVVTPPSLLDVKKPDLDEGAAALELEAQGAIGEGGPTMPLVRIDHDNVCFTIDESRSVDFIDCYLLHYKQARSYWDSPYSPGDTGPPVCYSSDMLKPNGDCDSPQSRTCDTCDHAKFGSSATGKGQACRTLTFVLIASPELFRAGPAPIGCLIVPPSSMRELLGGKFTPGYLQRAKNFAPKGSPEAQHYQRVWTRLTLDKVKGAVHCNLHATPLGVAYDPNECALLGKFLRELTHRLGALAGSVRDVADPRDAAENGDGF